MDQYASARDQLAQGLSFIDDFGYSLTSATVVNPAGIRTMLRMSYEAPAIARRITIFYFAGDDYLAPYFVVSILNLKMDDSMSVGTYLELKGLGAEADMLESPSSNDEKQRIDQFLCKLSELCNGPLQNIIRGQDWEAVPIQYGDMR